MATQVDAPSKQIKQEDFVQFLNIFSSEFNSESLHDRVLVFEIIEPTEEVEKVSAPAHPLSTTSFRGQASQEESQTTSFENNITCDKEEEKANQDTASKNNESTSDVVNVNLEGVDRIGNESENDSVDTKQVEGQENEKGENAENEIAKDGLNKNKKEVSDNMEVNETNTTKLFVHSCWLAVHSSYFKALFFSGMKETHLKEVVMKVKQSELQAHLTLIEAMYKLDILDDKDCRLVVDVLALADKYDVNIVFKKCKYVLISSSISLHDCEYILKIISGISDCTNILEVMEEFLVKEFSPLDKTWLLVKFRKLSKASLKLLLGSDKLEVESENTVFVALMKWINGHLMESIWEGRSLLSLVRFELMTVNFMYDVVRHHTMAKRLDGFNEFLQQGLAYHAFSPNRLRQLKMKPVSRSAYHRTDLDPTFSWVIDHVEQHELIDNGEILSSSFWLKGYEMIFQLYYKAIPKKSYSFYLFVQNIGKEAYVTISWRAKSNLFATSINCDESTYDGPEGHGFSMNSRIAPSKEPNTSPQTIDVWVNIL